MRTVRRLLVEASAPAPEVAFGSADEWRVVLMHDGVPLSQFAIADPGSGGAELVERLILRHARASVVYEGVAAGLRERLGATRAFAPALPVSLVVCTHRRSRYLPDVLQGVAALDPAPDEVVVVDNDPGAEDSRAIVEDSGARYVRENRRGLDNARNAGIRAAHGELIAFTDDDCIPSPGWLRALPELFADPLVGAVTGPAFAHSFDHPAQRRFEDSGGFGRGFKRRVFGWTTDAPAHAGRAGAGANMILRRAAIEAIGEVFPPELDAGTRTESGGDMYAIYELLAAGWRVVYDPATYVFHQHRESWEAMHRAFGGYGVGLSATLTRLLLQHRDPQTVAAWMWLRRQYVEALARRAEGDADALDVRIAWDYLRGGFRGPLAWALARREAVGADGWIAPGPAVPEARSEPADGPAPLRVSVVVTTADRPAALARCLWALSRQTAAPFETIVVDDRGGAAIVPGAPPGTVLVRAGRLGAAAARNLGAEHASGDVVLFLDDDLVPAPDLVARHARRHAEGAPRVVVGRSEPCPPNRNLAARGATAWWQDDFRRRAGAIVPTFVDMLSGNMSMPLEVWRRLGGFDAAFGALRREDWEIGVRLLRDGVGLEYDPEAGADHEFTLTTAGALEAAAREGEGDALLAARHPETRPTIGKARRRRGRAIVLSAGGGRPLLAALMMLERVGAVRAWWRLFGAAREMRYAAGRSQAPTPRGSGVRPAQIELSHRAPISAPRAAVPEIALTHRGRVLARLVPSGGRWSGDLAGELAAHVPWEVASELGGLAADAQDAPEGRSLTVLPWPGDAAALDAALARAESELVGFVAGGRLPDGEWATDALALFAGARIDAVVGAGLPRGEPPAPAFLRSRRGEPRAYRPSGQPPLYAIVRRDRLAAVGHLGTRVEGLGPHAAIAELVDRLLDDGGLVAGLDLAAFRRPRLRAVRAYRELARTRARSQLMWRRAAEQGGLEGARWLARTEPLPLLARMGRGGRRRRALTLAQLGAFLSAAPSAVDRRTRRRG